MLVLLYIYLVPIIYQVGKLAQWPYQDKTLFVLGLGGVQVPPHAQFHIF